MERKLEKKKSRGEIRRMEWFLPDDTCNLKKKKKKKVARSKNFEDIVRRK